LLDDDGWRIYACCCQSSPGEHPERTDRGYRVSIVARRSLAVEEVDVVCWFERSEIEEKRLK